MEKNEFLVQQNEKSNVRRVIAVMSGKGGVGKSLVTSLSAVSMMKEGYRVAVLDADITGPSIPKSFGVTDSPSGTEGGAYPPTTQGGIKIMSSNLILPNEDDPIIWKGPLVSAGIKQFWRDIIWGDIDYMFVDMPPGTGDVPLTVFQSLPISGILVVTSPQDLVSMIVKKAINMAKMMNIPVVGVIENFSYFKAPDTGNIYEIFGKSHTKEVCDEYGIELLAQLPINPLIQQNIDDGSVEDLEVDEFLGVVNALKNLPENKK